jgi:hypothetical protein
MKSHKDQHQGKLNWQEIKLANRMTRSPKKWFTSLEICGITGCVSARDKIRKLRANGIGITDAHFLRETETGAHVYGWRVLQ